MSAMGIIRRLFSGDEERSFENPSVSLADPGALAMLGLGEPSGPALGVSPQTALGVSAVYACVFIIARSLAWLPLNLLHREGPRQSRIADDVPLHGILRDTPNSYQTAHIFKLQMAAQALLWGNSYAEIQRDRRTGEVLGLYPIPSWNVDPRLNNGVKTFVVNGMTTFANEDIFHLMAPGFDGVRGLSPIRQHRMTVGMALEALAYGESFYRNGTRLAGALEHPNKVSDEAMARLRASWSATYAGKANAGKVAILEEGMKFSPFTMPMEDAQYVETRKFSTTDIARIYGVPPHKIGDLEKATFSNIEHQSIEFVIDALMPWLDQFEAEAFAKLTTERQRAAGYRPKFNVRALLRGDMKSQAEFLKIGREGGWYSADDAREFLDENPIDHPGGGEYLRPMNFVPLGTPAAPAAPAKEPAQ